MTQAPYRFVIHVHADGGAVLLDEQTREYTWMKDFAEVTDQIAGRVELARQPDTTGGEPCSEKR